MAWFHPKTLLDKTYEIGLIIKGIDGTFELLGALLILLVPRSIIERMTTALTRTELANNPHSFWATHLEHMGHELVTGSHWFAVLFLLTHGAVKVGLVIALLRQKLWAYPWALVTLTMFLIYQIYLLISKPTFGMAFLSVLDVLIIWLVWREWQQVKGKHAAPAS